MTKRERARRQWEQENADPYCRRARLRQKRLAWQRWYQQHGAERVAVRRMQRRLQRLGVSYLSAESTLRGLPVCCGSELPVCCCSLASWELPLL
jgi:ferric-dicitrate binding protein FerR (iron transport regulator)